MKKKLGIYILIAFIMFVPKVVMAETFNVSISGTKEAAASDKIDLTIMMKSENEAIGFQTTLKYDKDILELVGISKEDAWVGNNTLQSTGNNHLSFENKGITGETSIATLKFKVKKATVSTTTVSLEDTALKVNVKSGETIEQETQTNNTTIKKDIAIKSDDNKLKSIKIDDNLIAGFSSTIYTYDIEVDSVTESVKLQATLNNEKTSSFVDEFEPREVSLNYGLNKALLKIKSESGKVATYTINITRKDDRIANTDLKSIIINGGKTKIKFEKNVLSYTIKTFKLDTIDITAEPDDSTSTVKIDAPSKLIIGENKIKITVTAVTNDKKEYNLLIVNSEVATDTRLKNLAIKGLNIDFNSDKYDYEIRYDKSFKNGITIYKTALSADTEIEVIGNEKIKAGSIVKVIVTAMDGSGSSEYKIKIEKDNRINFFFIIDMIIGIVLTVLIVKQVRKRKKLKMEEEEAKKQEELEKTKEIRLD